MSRVLSLSVLFMSHNMIGLYMHLTMKL